MLGVERAEVEAAPLAHARAAARRWDCVVLLKGHHTLVAAPDGRVRVTTTGVPWLATAGAGDVLAGLVGALLAAGLEPYDAASVGSWLHGAAATEAAAGGPLTASRVAVHIAQVVRETLAGVGMIAPMTDPVPSRAEIVVDLAAIRHNVRILKDLVQVDAPVQLMVVVKADGYGHGMVEAAAPRARPAPTGWASPRSTRRSRCARPATAARCCAG